jgi:predicted DNA-binding transcriptional regulator AlpA
MARSVRLQAGTRRMPRKIEEAATKTATGFEHMLTAKDTANFLRLSASWLAKARMRGDGPPYVKIGRSVRYSEGALVRWLKSNQRLSTIEQ